MQNQTLFRMMGTTDTTLLLYCLGRELVPLKTFKRLVRIDRAGIDRVKQGFRKGEFIGYEEAAEHN